MPLLDFYYSIQNQPDSPTSAHSENERIQEFQGKRKGQMLTVSRKSSVRFPRLTQVLNYSYEKQRDGSLFIINLYGVDLVFKIGVIRVELVLVCSSLFEEFQSDLLKQCICENVLILLDEL